MCIWILFSLFIYCIFTKYIYMFMNIFFTIIPRRIACLSSFGDKHRQIHTKKDITVILTPLYYQIPEQLSTSSSQTIIMFFPSRWKFLFRFQIGSFRSKNLITLSASSVREDHWWCIFATVILMSLPEPKCSILLQLKTVVARLVCYEANTTRTQPFIKYQVYHGKWRVLWTNPLFHSTTELHGCPTNNFTVTLITPSTKKFTDSFFCRTVRLFLWYWVFQ